MSEYIEREALIADVCERCKGVREPCDSAHHCLMLEVIYTVPAANVRPVVLCRDCKHSDTFAPDCTEATFPLKCLSIRYGGVYPNWFCEHGEKREERCQ